MNRARFRRTLVVLALCALAALIVSTHVPFCPMAALIGVPCPGCGLSRATLALFHGNLREALRFHPLVFVIAPAFIWGIGSAAWDYVRGPRAYHAPHPWFTSRIATALASLLLLATLSVWGLRFFGYFGGPVPVLTLSAWVRSRAP
ncbi:MAG: DUF2752 domain-containing protein [Polyangiaceae bacterium]